MQRKAAKKKKDDAKGANGSKKQKTASLPSRVNAGCKSVHSTMLDSSAGKATLWPHLKSKTEWTDIRTKLLEPTFGLWGYSTDYCLREKSENQRVLGTVSFISEI